MIHPINWHIVIPLLYLCMMAFTAVLVAVKHEDLAALIVIVLACVWPLYYVTDFLIFIFENHAERKNLRKIKQNNFFDTTREGKDFLKNRLGVDNTKQLRKRKNFRVKKRTK